LDTISKTFSPDGGVTRTKEKVLAHVCQSDKVGLSANRTQLLVSNLMSLAEVPNHAQTRTIEMIREELGDAKYNAQKIARQMRKDW
jgi:hypothetical protein